MLREKAIPDPYWGSHERALQWTEEKAWTYAMEFTVDPALRSQREIDLVAEGLDTVATVILNGTELARTENMFIAHRWPIGQRLVAGKNRLEIRFSSPLAYIRSRRLDHQPREINDPVGGCTRIRKQQSSFGWDWGPRFATSGIWKPIYLQAWSEARIVTVQVSQHHARGRVRLNLAPELSGPAARRCRFRASLSQAGKVVASGEGLSLEVVNPQLWWPSGQGAQSLYVLEIECLCAGKVVDRWSRTIGLRTIVLEQKDDRFGTSFQFVVNGRALFAKGANWIPADALRANLGRAEYEPLLRSAVAAHMNMIRVWGGGVYENDAFYDLCDELGLLVWQDFMFSCTLYPGDRAFLRSVEVEAGQQVQRLRHHASLALWCGNNEIESLNPEPLKDSPKVRRAHDALFEVLLRRVVSEHDPATSYWRSSPAGSQVENVPKSANRLSGDWHDWDVWHARHPVKFYETSRARFVSEFGMQSFSSPAVAATYADPADWNIFAPAMENHQKNPSGNAILLDYLARRYRFPRDYAGLAYLSQLNQAYCMKVAVEHWRRQAPRTMGALYWQLNDCWPVASWSTLEFGGRWKIAHFAARRFFAPMLVSAHVHGDELAGIGNRLRNTMGRVDLYSVYDHPVATTGELRWELWHLGKARVLRRGKQRVALVPGESRCWAKLDLSRDLQREGVDNLALHLILSGDGQPDSSEIVVFTAPRNLPLVKSQPGISIRAAGPGEWRITVSSKTYLHGAWLDLPGRTFSASENGFDLLPGLAREIVLGSAEVSSEAELAGLLTIRSLVDSY